MSKLSYKDEGGGEFHKKLNPPKRKCNLRSPRLKHAAAFNNRKRQMSKPKKKTEQFVVEVDLSELSLRILEYETKYKRPNGMTAKSAFQDIRKHINENDREAILFIIDRSEKISEIAIEFFVEQMNKPQQVQQVH